jgi:ABC-type uncharacterized transport system substrate-binding protein
MKSFLRAVLALIIVAMILLLSDLENRNKKKVSHQAQTNIQSEAVAGKHYTLGYCYFAPEASVDELLSGIWRRMEELGFKRDSNLTVKASHANGELSNMAAILLNMDNQPMDLLMVISTPTITAAITTIKKHPVVFTYSYDPIAAGAGKSLEDHLPGITGVATFPPLEKSIRFIQETIPGTKKIGTIFNSSEANSRKVVSVMREIAANSGFTLVEISVVNSSEVFQAAQVMASKGVDAVYIPGDNTVRQAFEAVAGVCKIHSIPVTTNHVTDVNRGAFACVGLGWEGIGYHTGDLIGKLLNGASPDTIPIENYVVEKMVINEELTKELGLTIPEKYRKISVPVINKSIFRLAMVHYIDNPNTEDCEKGIRKALGDDNMHEDIDFTFKVYNAQGDISTLNSIAGSLGNEAWDVIFTTSTPTIQMLAKKMPSKKIVFTNVGDPLSAGLGNSFEDHLQNICGISTMSDFEGMIELIHYLHPGIKRAGTVFTPGEINSLSYKNELIIAAGKKGIEIIAVPANTATEVLDAANSLVSQGIDVFCQISDNLTGSCSSAILKVASDNKIPYYGFVTNQLRQGAVAVCARDYFQAGYEAGEMGIAILSGKSPSQIPFRYVSKTDYLFNPEAARFHHIEITNRTLEAFPQLKSITQ